MFIILKTPIQAVQGKKAFSELLLRFPFRQGAHQGGNCRDIRQRIHSRIIGVIETGVLLFFIPQFFFRNIPDKAGGQLQRGFPSPLPFFLISIHTVQNGQHRMRAASITVTEITILRHPEIRKVSQQKFGISVQYFLIFRPAVSDTVSPGQKKKLHQMGITDILFIETDPQLFKGIPVLQRKGGILAYHGKSVPQQHFITVTRLVFQVCIFCQEIIKAAHDSLKLSFIDTQIGAQLLTACRQRGTFGLRGRAVQTVTLLFQNPAGGSLPRHLLQENLFLIGNALQLSGLLYDPVDKRLRAAADLRFPHQRKPALAYLLCRILKQTFYGKLQPFVIPSLQQLQNILADIPLFILQKRFHLPVILIGKLQLFHQPVRSLPGTRLPVPQET